MPEDKKTVLYKKINEFIRNVLDQAESQKKLDYINIEIINHQGSLQMDYKLRDREKAY